VRGTNCDSDKQKIMKIQDDKNKKIKKYTHGKVRYPSVVKAYRKEIIRKIIQN